MHQNILEAGCSESEYECDNGKCISASFICDWEDDCGDYSDESNCENTEGIGKYHVILNPYKLQ